MEHVNSHRGCVAVALVLGNEGGLYDMLFARLSPVQQTGQTYCDGKVGNITQSSIKTSVADAAMMPQFRPGVLSCKETGCDACVTWPNSHLKSGVETMRSAGT